MTTSLRARLLPSGARGKNGMVTTAITIFKSMVGLGIFSTPMYFSNGGWLLSSLLTGLITFLSGYNLTLFAEVVDYIERHHASADLNQMEDCIEYVVSGAKAQKALFWGESDQ